MTELDQSVQQDITEGWSQKYKSSINCSHPKGFSQKAHCAGKKKHTESVETEMTCPDCGMCKTHGSLNEIAKGAKDSNGFTRCWPGKHAEGTKKGKNGGQVRNCVPNESQGVAEAFENDESNMMYRFNPETGRLGQRMIHNNEEQVAHRQGYRDSHEAALKAQGVIRSKFKPGKWVQKQGNSWTEVFPYGKPDGVDESATAGATSAANVGVGAVYNNKPPKQPKNKDGTAKNAVDMKGVNLLTGGSLKR